MKKNFSKCFLLAASLFIATRGLAMPVEDAGTWTLMGTMNDTLLVNFGAEISHLVETVTALQTALKKLENFTSWQDVASEVTGKLNNLGQVSSSMSQLAYSASNAGENFKKTFPGYTPPTNYTQSYSDIVNNTKSVLEATLKVIGMSAGDFQNENTRLGKLQGVVQSASGTTSAIQAASQIATEEVNQLQLLRQTMISQTNAQTTYYAAQMQKEASAKAEMNNIIQAGDSNITKELDSNPLNNPVIK